jgi:hypothetical protein
MIILLLLLLLLLYSLRPRLPATLTSKQLSPASSAVLACCQRLLPSKPARTSASQTRRR